MMQKPLIILQARMSSSRLPHKILLPFYQNLTILDVITQGIIKLNNPFVIATTTNSADDCLEQYCSDNSILCFRGNENDVLGRFIQCAKAFDYNRIIRVCSDNPFLDMHQLEHIINISYHNSADYIAFNVSGTPAIKTHYGFWTESVTLNALERVNELTDQKLYHEHVTNYIYEHPDIFNIQWLDVPDIIAQHPDTRLTIDTENDFKVAQYIYNTLKQKQQFVDINSIFKVIDSNPQLADCMKIEILKNSK